MQGGGLGNAASKAVSKSRSARPATGGNKNVSNVAKRSDQTAGVKSVIKGNLKGPFSC